MEMLNTHTDTQYEECETGKLYIVFAVHYNIQFKYSYSQNISFFEACNKSDCAFIWSLKTKRYLLDVNRFHNIGYEAVCIAAVFKLLSLLF